MNHCLSGGKSAVTVATSSARREPTPKESEGSHMETSWAAGWVNWLTHSFHSSVCSWLLILAYPLLYGIIIKDSWSWYNKYWGFFFLWILFLPRWWIWQSGVCFPNQQAFLPACKSPKQVDNRTCIASFLSSLFCLKKSIAYIWLEVSKMFLSTFI